MSWPDVQHKIHQVCTTSTWYTLVWILITLCCLLASAVPTHGSRARLQLPVCTPSKCQSMGQQGLASCRQACGRQGDPHPVSATFSPAELVMITCSICAEVPQVVTTLTALGTVKDIRNLYKSINLLHYTTCFKQPTDASSIFTFLHPQCQHICQHLLEVVMQTLPFRPFARYMIPHGLQT